MSTCLHSHSSAPILDGIYAPGPCQDCGKREWARTISTPHGPMKVCNQCGEELQESRRNYNKPGLYRRFLSAVYRAFGRAVPLEWEGTHGPRI